jgi:flavorubredoxin
MINTTEIARGIYRVSFLDEADLAEFTFPDFSYNLFLIDGDRPAIINTMFRRSFGRLRDQVAQIVDPAELAYIVVPHHTGDSSGALNDWLTVAPNAVPVCSQLCFGLSLCDFADRLRFLMTPHIDQWDSMMVYEEATGTLFPNDLFSIPGPEVLLDSDVSDTALAVARQAGYQPDDRSSLEQALEKISCLDVKALAVMHGPTIRGHIPELCRSFRRNALALVAA